LRFALVGATVACVYVGLTLLLSGPLGIAIEIAILVAYVLAVILHFLLQRYVVFRGTGEFALSVRAQVLRYVLIGIVQYSLTAAATNLLPGPLDLSEQVVYVLTVIVISAMTFLFLRSRVFHSHERQPS
jgi:putative flippase GtrA